MAPAARRRPSGRRVGGRPAAGRSTAGRRSAVRGAGEALDLHLRLHRRLATDLGMEPMPGLQRLQRLHHGILSGSPEYEALPLPAG